MLTVPMASTNGKHPEDPVLALAGVAAAARLARALVSAFDVAEEGGAPLSATQKITLIEVALLEFDGFEAELGSLRGVVSLLQEELGSNGLSPHRSHE